MGPEVFDLQLKRVVAGYDKNADRLLKAYEQIKPTTIYRPFARFFPDQSADILDLGSGSGRDAAWMAGQGHRVVALEPAANMRMAAMARHKLADINWLDGSLPDLAALNKYPNAFDFVLANAVWHHLSRAQSFRAFVRLKAVLRHTGNMLVSLRHGPAPPDRPGTGLSPMELTDTCEAAGFLVRHSQKTGSQQPENREAGIDWHWFVLCHSKPS